MDKRYALPEEIVTIAERLQSEGYATAGFTENFSVSESLQFSQGFETFKTTPPTTKVPNEIKEGHKPALDIAAELYSWLREGSAEKPVFIFANLYQAHSPYQIRPNNKFLPQGVDLEAVRMVKARVRPQNFICNALPHPDELEILEGLYLGDVAAADARLDRVWETVRDAMGGRRLITIVVSDHGEHLGEHRLLFHYFSVRDSVLRVPLIVHGLPDVSPAIIEESVGLIDIVPSILAWTGSESEAELPGRVLPTVPDDPVSKGRSLIAAYDDSSGGSREFCTPSDQVFGKILSLIRFPFKLIRFDDDSTELYDLRWDFDESADLSIGLPDKVAELKEELNEFIEESRILQPSAESPPKLSEEDRDMLRNLGYIE